MKPSTELFISAEKKEFAKDIEPYIQEIFELWSKSQDIDISPDEIKEWIDIWNLLIGTIFDFTLFYNEQGMKNRYAKNRKDYFKVTIKRYYLDLENFKRVEAELNI